MEIQEKLDSIRSLINKYDLDAYIVPSTDPHISEYVPEKYKSRAWISGFTGSVATFVVTQNHAGIWTDGRYFLQAEEELAGTEIELHKLGVSGHLDYPEWLNENLKEKSVVGFDGFVFSIAEAQKLKQIFELKNIQINSDYDLIDELWEDRPDSPKEQIFVQPENFAGKNRIDKIADIRNELANKNCDHTLISSLDDIAWTLNIRGKDVPFNPVVVSFLLITPNSVKLFIEGSKVPFEVHQELENDGIDIIPYYEIEEKIKNLPTGINILIDPRRSNYKLFNSVPEKCNVILDQNISTLFKAKKNPIEIAGMRMAMKRDLLALVDFQYWLENNYKKNNITELAAAAKLRECRATQELFFGESFNTISGMAGNGAIIHYASNEKSNRRITNETFYLLDSGGQYYDGTTDITRVFHFGEPSAQERKDFTLVLKGMIQLTQQKFPAGTRGGQLDSLARQFIWNNFIDYGHGTGHGVGCFMNVHEGPQNIRKEINPTALEEGMILSNEPGIYRANEYGIRLENIILTEKLETSAFGDFYGFETLTLYPIETKCIDRSLLSREEINWLNSYHKTVYEAAEDKLDEEKRKWLKEKTKAI